jgi:predicted permease
MRMLRMSPGFSTVVVFTVALGIGANSSVFNVINSLMLRTLPVVEPHRLVTVSTGNEHAYPWTYTIWEEIRRRAKMFDGAVAWAPARFDLAQGGEKHPIEGLYVNGDFFRTLGVQALLGRTFTSAEDVRGGGPDGPVAVISYGLWQRRYGGAADVIGTPLVLDRVPFTIIGVTPPAFFGVEVGRIFDVAVPISTEALINGLGSNIDRPRAWWLTVMLRLQREQSLAAATATLRALQPQIREAAMPQNAPVGARQEFLNEPFTLAAAATGTSRLRERYKQPLLTIQTVVALVLLIACTNIANLLMARAMKRRRDTSIRIALGASHWHLARQLLIETFLLAGAGAVLGLLIAVWASHAIVAQLGTAMNPVAMDLSFDWRMLAFTFAVTFATAVLFGTAPAFRSIRVAPREALNEQCRGVSIGGGRVSLSSGFVVAQVAISLVLLVAAGLLVRTLQRLANVSLGFDSDRVLVVNVNATHASTPEDRIVFRQRLIDAVAAVPGVARAAASSVTPVSGSLAAFPVYVPGGAPMSGAERRVLANYVTPEWFATYGTTLLAGRDIDDYDARNSAPVALVNEAFVRKFMVGRNPIGIPVTPLAPPGGAPSKPKMIVGIVKDAVYLSLREAPQPTVYLPLAQHDSRVPWGEFCIGVRTSAESPRLLARAVAAALTATDRNLAFSFRPLSDQVDASLAQERLVAMISGFFGGLALLLVGLGLYGITSYAATARRAEIGIRMALGARRMDVINLVLGRTVGVTLAGLGLGLLAAAWVTRYLKSMLFGLTPLDPSTLLAVFLLFLIVAGLAGLLPALRAARSDPLLALRYE